MAEHREYNDHARTNATRHKGSMTGPIVAVIGVLLALAAVYWFATSGGQAPTAAPDIAPATPVPAPEPAEPVVPAPAPAAPVAPAPQ